MFFLVLSIDLLMDIRFLESLIAVVEKGSIAEASRKQAITPAAISQRIQALERELNCQLLNRVTHKAKPTEACLNILPRAKKLLSESRALHADVDKTGLSGTIRIGAISTALTSMIPKTLKKLGQFAPNAKLKITPGTSASLYEALQKEQIDAAILVKPPFPIPKHFSYQVLRTEPLVLLSDHRITDSVEDELNNYPYIRYDPASWGGRIAEQFIIDHDIVKESICDLDGLETISVLVMQGLGVSLVPKWPQIYFGKKSVEGELWSKQIHDTAYNRELVLISSYYPDRPQLINKFVNLLNGKTTDY